jgi:hypothetical protein
MAVATSTILAVAAAASAAVGVASYVQARQANADAQADRQRAYEEQLKSNSEQNALNAQRAAAERRNQIREERVRRAKIMQASENTGTDGGSGELGALSSLSTQYNDAVASNVGTQAASQRISIFSQNAANYQNSAQQHDLQAQQAKELFSLSGTIFNATGGGTAIKNYFKTA